MSSSRRIDSTRSNQDDASRRRTRSLSPPPPRRLHDNDGNDHGNVGVTPAPKRRKSKRNLFSSCDEILNLPKKWWCSGCNHYKDFGTKPRDEYTTSKYECYKAWTRKEDAVPKIRMEHWKGITNYIANDLEIALGGLVEDDKVEANVRQEETTTTPLEPPAVTPAEREVRMELNTFRSYGKEHNYWIPYTHKIAHADHNKRWENEVGLLARVRHKLQRVLVLHNKQRIFGNSVWHCHGICTSACLVRSTVFDASVYDGILLRHGFVLQCQH